MVAIDSLKGSLTSLDAGEAIKAGIHRVDCQTEVVIKPLADGGEGTVVALTNGLNGTLVKQNVTGPLGELVEATYGIVESIHGKTAIIEMAEAAGITLVPTNMRNPLYTTTYGVGELIQHALSNGCKNFIIGIGGSATNDGGVGMLQALGYGFYMEDGASVPQGAIGLKSLAQIEDTNINPMLKECTFHIACDVTNPLCGQDGCSAIFGPQKGATPEMIAQMDEWLSRYAGLVEETYEKADATYPGTGAAGGLGFAFLAFMNAKLQSGVQIVLEETGVEEEIKKADLIVTGEGRLDSQTAMGKAPIGVAKLAKKHGKKVIAFAGSVAEDARLCNREGIDAFFPIVRGPISLEEAMKTENAKSNLEESVVQVFRLLNM